MIQSIFDLFDHSIDIIEIDANIIFLKNQSIHDEMIMIMIDHHDNNQIMIIRKNRNDENYSIIKSIEFIDIQKNHDAIKSNLSNDHQIAYDRFVNEFLN